MKVVLLLAIMSVMCLQALAFDRKHVKMAQRIFHFHGYEMSETEVEKILIRNKMMPRFHDERDCSSSEKPSYRVNAESLQLSKEEVCPSASSIKDSRKKPRTNGCGTDAFFNIGKGREDYLGPCCDRHDCCYDSCGVPRSHCDEKFKQCMVRTCNGMSGNSKIECEEDRKSFSSWGTGYWAGRAYRASQLRVCECQSEKRTIATRAPMEWICPVSFYNASDGCDCDCGAYDPDCNNSNDVFGCSGAEPSCDINGTCVVGQAPPGWICDPIHYSADDGCDCECGVEDPDCLITNDFPFGCNEGEICVNGLCEVDFVVPLNWICPISYYNSSDGCDCNCGAEDPDCNDEQQVALCPCETMQCDRGFCVGDCNGVTISINDEIQSESSSACKLSHLFYLF